MKRYRTPPMPLEWHPWYRDKTWLLDWLTGGTRPVVEIPIMQPLYRMVSETDPALAEAGIMNRVTLTKNRAIGAAPYVGKPFCYVWWVATDQYGRGIASDSEIHYLG